MLYSLKWTIQLWHAIILGLVLAALGIGFYHYEKGRRISEIDQLLDQEIPPLVSYSRTGNRSKVGLPPPRNARRRPGDFGAPLRNPYRLSPQSDATARPDSESSGRPLRPDGRPPYDSSNLLLTHIPIEQYANEPIPEDWEVRQMPIDSIFSDEDSPPVAGADIQFLEDVLVPRGFYVKMVNPNNHATIYSTDNFPQGVEIPSTRYPRYLVRTRDGLYREMHHVNSVVSILIGYDLTTLYAQLDTLKLQILGGALSLFIIGVGVGYILVSHSLKPLRIIEQTTDTIAQGDLEARIPDEYKGRTQELNILADNLNHTFAQLDSLFERQKRFTADASHELRTPLTVLLAQLELSQKRRRSVEEYEKTLEICLRSAKRIRRITNQLIELARYDSGRVRMDWQEMPLDILLHDLAEELEPYIEEKGSRLIVNLQPGKAYCDPFRLEQVINNLVNNALQHNDRPITITINLSFSKESVCIEIMDNGKGVQPENIDKLFDRFFQENIAHAKNKAEENIGLGLAICKAIIEAHSGKVSVKSTPHELTVFTISLPRAKANQ